MTPDEIEFIAAGMVDKLTGADPRIDTHAFAQTAADIFAARQALLAHPIIRCCSSLCAPVVCRSMGRESGVSPQTEDERERETGHIHIFPPPFLNRSDRRRCRRR